MSFLFASSKRSTAGSVNGDASAAATTPSTKTHKLLLRPPANIQVLPRPTLSAEQQTKVTELRKHLVELHKSGLPEDDPYHSFEAAWIEEDYLPERYLKAVNWDLNAAKARIKATLEWRRSFQPERIPPDEVKPEALTGKHCISGFDRQGRPFFTVTPRHENTKTYDRQMRYMIWSFERCIQLMPKGVTQLNWVMSLEGQNQANNPPLSYSRIALSLVQQHYPERLSRAICNRGPWFFSLFFKLISPFIDPNTRAKVFFNPHMTDFADPEQISTEWEGGQHDYEWDFESYWAQLTEYCGLKGDGSRLQGPIPVDQNKLVGSETSQPTGTAQPSES
ncbi:hypothetical protein OC846_000400 [Tilletia horrida]|uniref:CRAL-TRIO domain-containing protein n=1 Tax=Tilletia horrida TaxID=155126 RepID=A0AAN6GVD6_9BASI|nr:hypothetical protein OC845_000011 [Tilletia horrida]KAK0557612.1 hypothetical protein OC846_000400 [Tilletia horrida]